MSPPLFVYTKGECDPKKCTAQRLIKYEFLKKVRRIPKKSILLDPNSIFALSKSDLDHIKKYGLSVFDCSWNKFSEITNKHKNELRRSLPFLIPVNPINYGKASKLSTAEALSGALYILGELDLAQKIINIFKWGPHFIPHNLKFLKKYINATNSDEIIEAQKEIIGEEDGEILNS